MKVNTEWGLGVLAFVCNVIAGTFIIFTMLFGITINDINLDIIWCLFGVYLVSLTLLFWLWVDKFNYIED